MTLRANRFNDKLYNVLTRTHVNSLLPITSNRDAGTLHITGIIINRCAGILSTIGIASNTYTKYHYRSNQYFNTDGQVVVITGKHRGTEMKKNSPATVAMR